MKTNVYDRQLASDGRILHFLGLMLQRDEHNTATPKPADSIFFGAAANRDADSPSLQSAAPAVAAQSGCSTNQVNTPLSVCAWCDSEAGVAIDPKGPLVSHGICARHLAQMKSDLESQRRQAA